MACQSKTFINDLGSDVVAEITSQLNNATGILSAGALPYTFTGGGGVHNCEITILVGCIF